MKETDTLCEGDLLVFHYTGAYAMTGINGFFRVEICLLNFFFGGGGGRVKRNVKYSIENRCDWFGRGNFIGAQQMIRAKKPVIVMEYGTHSEHIADALLLLNS